MRGLARRFPVTERKLGFGACRVERVGQTDVDLQQWEDVQKNSPDLYQLVP